MKIFYFLTICFLFTTCAKYDEGGKCIYAPKHLYAQNGEWFLKSYEVNGADSTKNLFVGRDSLRKTIKFRAFKLKNDVNYQGIIESEEYRVPFNFKSGNKIFSNFGSGDKCPCVFSSSKCIKNIFHHNFTKQDNWTIIKLTNQEFVIETFFKKYYKVTLVRNYENYK
jgi:hypothetical protein